MRRGVLVLALLALAGCAQKPAAPVALGPLGPCPVVSWKPEAPPTASAKVSMVLLAVQEWARFGQQVITYSPDAPPRLEQLGIKERDAPERIRDYWRSVGRPNLSGLDTEVPWSAAFVSWVIASAGVPRELFCPDQRHTIYVERIVERARAPGAAFVPHEPEERRPEVGDLVCASRDGGRTTLRNLDRGPGHCDIVVEVRPGEVHVVGGNVGDSVTRSVLPLDRSGLLQSLPQRTYFAVIENRLP